MRDKPMVQTVQSILFDLDGTLLDSLADLTLCANEALTEMGMPTHDRECYRYFVGNGMETLMERAAPKGAEPREILELVKRMRETYAKNWAVATQPYAGITRMLERLGTMGISLAVLSNKPHDFTVRIVEHFFPRGMFDIVQGNPGGGLAKPDPTLALTLAEKLGAVPEECLFMGDSSVDMDTARAAGMVGVGVLWGFRTRDELIAHGASYLLDHPEDLFKMDLTWRAT